LNKKYIKLIDFDGIRKNNFTAIRIFFAWLVLYGHSYAIEKSHGIVDPLNALFKGSTWIGAIAVNGFFVISGYLVAGSFAKRGFFNFIISRSLRIYPALIFCILFSIFFIGPIFTELEIDKYFNSKITWHYFRNMLAALEMKWYLPGVFEKNSFPSINGSLWSLTVEVRCYVILACLGLASVFKNRFTLNFSIVSIFTLGIFFYDQFPLIGSNNRYLRPSMYFLIGVLFYSNRKNIVIDTKILIFCTILMFISFGKKWFDYSFPLAFSYSIFYIAYNTRYLEIDKYIGDLSYGIYIFSWPIQQSVAQLFPIIGPIGNTIISTFLVMIMAYLSWHYIEKPTLSLKHKLLNQRNLPDSVTSKSEPPHYYNEVR